MNVGPLLLNLALITAVVSGVCFALEAHRPRRLALGTWSYLAHTVLLAAALALLCFLFVTRRYEYTYVAQYSSRALSPALALAAVWAGQEGSILLWAAISAALGVALLFQPGRLARPAMMVVGLAQVLFLVLLAAKSPFAVSAITPADGRGLNPLLEDPWMVIHPPILFVGYAALLIPFAISTAALVLRDYREWNRMVWPWALFGVVSLGAGIALGGVWAYKVLGWGGYWGWDPVENASFVPWLVVVALLHGLLIQRTTGGLPRLNLVLAFCGWLTVLGGTYLTRSGVLQDFSVHSFPNSGLNLPLSATLIAFGAIAGGLLASRWRTVSAGLVTEVAVSRESALWLGMLTVLMLGGLVTIGTTAPLLTSLFGKPASVQPIFYQSVSVPLGIILVVLMGLSPALRWYRQNGLSWIAALVPGAVAAVLITAFAMFAGLKQPGYLLLVAVTGLALAVNVVVAARLFKRGWMYGAGYLGHAGVAVMVLGMALSAGLGKSERLALAPGQSTKALGYDVTYRGVRDGTRGDRTLDLTIAAPGWTLTAHPALIPSPQGEGMVRKPAISGWRELYLSPLELQERAVADAEPTWLARGVASDIAGARVTFERFRMESTPQFMVYADLAVEKDGQRSTVSPALAAGPDGSRPIEAEAPGIGMLSIASVDADHDRVALRLPAVASAVTVAVLELSTKPFINLVWVGALFVFLGTALAGLRRARERVPAAAHSRSFKDPSRPAPKRRDRSQPEEKPAMLSPAPRAADRSTGTPGVPLALLAALSMGGVLAGSSALAAESKNPDPVRITAASIPDTTRPLVFLKEIVVTGARYPRAYYESPQALSFVSRRQLLEQAPTTVGDVLSTLPGVDECKDSPWEQRPVLRGLSGQRVLVLMDGSPMNSARGNGPHPSLVDPGQIERIEVVRGPASVSYGSDALGGAINIITREAPLASPGSSLRGSATAGGSSVDRQRNGYLELVPRIGKFSAFLSSGARKAENFRSPNGEVPNSSFSDYNALFNLRYDFTDRLALKSGYQLYRGKDIGIPGLSFDSPGARQAFEFSNYDRDVVHLTLDHRHEHSWIENSRIKTYWQREQRNFFSDQVLDASMYTAFGLPPRTGSASVQTLQDRFFDLDTYGFQLQAISRRTDRYRFTTGVDFARDETNGDNVRYRTYHDASGNPVPGPGDSPPTAVRITASVPDGRFDNYAGFAQTEWYLHRQLTANLGGRFTHYRYRTDYGLSSPASGPSPAVYFEPKSVDDDALAGSFGLVYAPVQDLHVTANLASGYREPNAQDLFFNGAASVGFVLGNPDLKPEKSLSYDLGLRWGPGDLAVSGNVFITTFDDLIDAIALKPAPGTPPGTPSTYQYVNIATARMWGGEAEAEWQFRPGWRARVTAAGTVGDITNAAAIASLYGVTAERAPLPNVPPFKGTAAVRWRDGSGRFWVEPSVRYSWRTNRLPFPTPGVSQLTEFKSEWIVGDLFAGAKFSSGQRLALGIRNITDTPYRQALASLEDPGFSLVGSLSTDF